MTPEAPGIFLCEDEWEVECLIAPLRDALHPRRYGLKNRERTNRLLLLMQLNVNRQADALRYAKSIRAWLEANDGRPRVARRAVTDRGGRPSLR